LGIADESTQRPCVLCLAARDEADEIAGMMLAQLLSTGEFLVRSAAFTWCEQPGGSCREVQT